MTRGGNCAFRRLPPFVRHKIARASTRSTSRQSSSNASDPMRAPVPTKNVSSGGRCGAAAAIRRPTSCGKKNKVRPRFSGGATMCGGSQIAQQAAQEVVPKIADLITRKVATLQFRSAVDTSSRRLLDG